MEQIGRPREFEPDEMIEKIMLLFWENGYEATGLSDIQRVTGLGKASLYSAFGNKKAMYMKAMAHYERLVVDEAVDMLRSARLPPRSRIETFLSLPISAVKDQGDRRGCFLCNASADRASLDNEIATLVRKGYEKLRKAIEAAIRGAYPDKQPDAVKAQAMHVLVAYAGLRTMARSDFETENLHSAKMAAMTALDA